MKNEITRRDYLNGVALLLAGTAVGCGIGSEQETTAPSPSLPEGYYPPTLTGMRGSHEGSYEAMHELAWAGIKPAEFTDLDEEYDLVIVGAGISGLASAYFYQQQAGSDKRILILDNHDDFGGHAKRNEFSHNGRMFLGGGGTGNFEDAKNYSPEAKRLVSELGFDLDKLRQAQLPVGFNAPFTDENSIGMYTNRDTYGADSIVPGAWMVGWQGMGNYRENIEALPLPAEEKATLIGFIEGTIELKKPLPEGDILKTMKSIDYQTFATEYVGLSKQTTKLFEPFLRVTFCTGTDSISILEGIKSGLPALSVLGEDAITALMSSGFAFEGVDFVYLPDGMATLTRQIVRRLIPGVAPGDTIDDLIDARFDYQQLDKAGQSVRIRLNSPVVNVANTSDGGVTVSYIQDGKSLRVKAKGSILACYNGVIPHLCPEMPEEQKANVSYGVKSPLLAVNILLRNSQPFIDGGAEVYLCPNDYFGLVTRSFSVNVGNYKAPVDADEPMVLYMMTSPMIENDGSLTSRDIYRLARHELLTKSFEEFEQIIRDQLSGLLSGTDFDADRDILAITLNRWSHGYAYGYLDLYDPEWPEGEAPHELGRIPVGRLSIAGSDSEAHSYVNGAVDAAWRAVKEQLS